MSDLLLDPEFLASLERCALGTRRIFTGRMRGERKSKRRGISVEFADYRDYSEGDDLRRVDWNIYGRLDRLFLKLFMEEEDLFLYVVVDTSHSMGFGSPAKLEHARKIAAALGYIGLLGGERVHLAAAASRLDRYTPPLRGRRSVWRMFDFLAGMEPAGRTSLARVAREIALRFRRKGLLVVISDLLDPQGFEGALKSLIGTRMEIHIIHLLAQEDLVPELAGDYKLVDIETEELVEVTASRPMLDSYRRTLDTFRRDVKDFCAARGATYAFTSTAEPVEDFVLRSLKRTGLLK